MERLIRGDPAYFESSGRGRPIIVLHGTPLDHRAMRAALDPIITQRDGWDAIYPDLPGHGKTRGPDWILGNDEMLEWIVDFIEAETRGQEFAIIGLSYGGYLARGVAHRLAHRTSGLFLWSPVKYPRAKRKRPPRTVRTQNEAIAAGLQSENERALFNMLVHQTAEAMEFLRTYMVPAADIADEEFLERVVDTTFSFDLTANPFEKPTLILCGRQDATAGYLDAFETLESYPKATYVIADDAGHTLGLIERRTLFCSLVNDWLDSLGGG